MAPNETKVDTPAQGTEDKGKDAKQKVADYLQAPRKKRKSYVLAAMGAGTGDLQSGVEAFIRTTFKGVAFAQPKTADELVKNFSRQVVLLIYDDEFVPLQAGLEMIRELKRKKSGAGVPVLFLTRQPETLVEAYNKVLLPYHESDEYVNYAKSEPNLLYSKIRTGLMAGYRRRSRRYKVDVALQYFLLADDQMHGGRLVDLSVHGALLRAEDNRVFRVGEQLKLHLPVGDQLTSLNGDYLRLSAKVRRVFISGTQAGVSFEHVSDAQLLTLTTYLTGLVNDQMARRTMAARARAAR